jgi:hypothetical protein
LGRFPEGRRRAKGRGMTGGRLCEAGHPMGQNDTFCRECAAEAPPAYSNANLGFSRIAAKNCDDWAIYWDRRIRNRVKRIGIKGTAREYGLELETVEVVAGGVP